MRTGSSILLLQPRGVQQRGNLQGGNEVDAVRTMIGAFIDEILPPG